MPAAINLAGQRFGKVLVIKPTEKRKPNGEVIWECRCNCGTTFFTGTGTLRYGTTKSCGCSHRENAIINAPAKTHGGSHRDRLYHVWRGMHDRCYYPAHNRYKNYGGRGIYICEEWRHDYAAFREWAMANGYDPEAPRGQCTIDRIDVDGPYAPWNCRWVDMKTQEANKKKKV